MATDESADDTFDLSDDTFDLGEDRSTGGGGVGLISRDFDGEIPEPPADATFEEASREEIGDTLRRMHAGSQAAMLRFATNTDVDYFVCVVFLSQDQKNQFVKAAGWDAARAVGGIATSTDSPSPRGWGFNWTTWNSPPLNLRCEVLC